MSVDDLAKWAGLLGFFISLATFLLTRWERRATLDFGLELGTTSDFGSAAEDLLETVNVSITNLGSRPALLNIRTLELRCIGNVLHVWRQDYFGSQQQEVLLKPTERHTIGVPLSTLISMLKIKSPYKYDKNTLYALRPVLVRLATTDGRRHESKKLLFWEATGEFHRA